MPSRYLKEGLLTSEAFDRLAPEEEAMFTRLLLAVDDFGRFDGRAVVVRSRCYPLKFDLPLDAIERRLDALHYAGLIVRYVVDGKPYVQVQKWTQQPRAKDSKFPPQGSATSSGVNATERSVPLPSATLAASMPPYSVTVTGTSSGSVVDSDQVQAPVGSPPVQADLVPPPEKPERKNDPEADAYMAAYRRLYPEAKQGAWARAWHSWTQAKGKRPLADLIRALEGNAGGGGEGARLSLAQSLADSWVSSGLLKAAGRGSTGPPNSRDTTQYQHTPPGRIAL